MGTRGEKLLPGSADAELCWPIRVANMVSRERDRTRTRLTRLGNGWRLEGNRNRKGQVSQARIT